MKYSWYKRDSKEVSGDDVQQILAFGNLDEILNLKKKVGKDRLEQLFLNYPKKIYSKPSLNFIKKFILDIDSQINDAQYLKDAHRNTGL